MTKRRIGSRPLRTYWTPEGVALIEAYQATHRIPSFSAAAETLVHMGLERSPAEIITPIIASAVQHAVHRELDRLIRVQIYTAIDAGMAYRFAAATARDVGRLKDDPPERYQRLKAFVRSDTRRRIAHGQIGTVLDDLFRSLDMDTQPGTTDDLVGAVMADDGEMDEYGDRKSKLSPAGTEDAGGSETGRPLLHVS